MTDDKPHTVKVNEYVKMAYINLGIDMVMKATADLIHVRSQTGFVSLVLGFLEECEYTVFATTHILLKNTLLSGREGGVVREAWRGHTPCKRLSRQHLQLTL
jgi:hypothetical protein